MDRRQFIHTSLGAVLANAVQNAMGDDKRTPKIVLRSSWQTVNIGDIAHTPGVLALLEKHIPNAEVRLWPKKVDNGVEEMLGKRFPKLALVQTDDEINAALKECDFLLHGSGPQLVGNKQIEKWAAETKKPYGIYGVTFSQKDQIPLINGAKFAFFRDSVSLAYAKDNGATCPIMEFGPDGAFAVDLRNDEAASAFLKASNLEDGKFLCCIPRLRITPYWKIHGTRKSARDEENHALSEKMKEHDHAKLREAIIAVVKETAMKVLLCPEDQSQMAVGKEMLYDPLPGDIKPRVVWREKYWLTDEALSTYIRSAGLFGNEMHSPIMCVGNGIPAVVCRWKQQTSKGFMWRDIGLGEWLFDNDDDKSMEGIVPAVLGIAKDPAGAKVKTAKAREVVLQRQRETMEILKKSLG